MPTIFSKCIDCCYKESESIDHYCNIPYKRDYDKMEILKSYGLPTEIAIKIIEMTYTYYYCYYCDNMLCRNHKNIVLYYGNTWPYITCYKCCREMTLNKKK